jgi:hypothetical protein
MGGIFPPHAHAASNVPHVLVVGEQLEPFSNSAAEMESTVPLETATTQTTSGHSVSPSSGHLPDNPPDRQASIASSSISDQNKDRATVPSACVQCRSKHLKCDGLSPCTRCSSNTLECIYVRSRRGFKGPRKNGTKNPPVTTGTTTPIHCPLVRPGLPAVRTSPSVQSGLATPPDSRLQTLQRASVDLPPFDIGQELVAFDKPLQSGLDLRERCIEAFFYHFYPAHPFILPRANFFALRKEKPVHALEAAMRYVGSFYVSQAPTVSFGLEAERSVYHVDCPKDGFRVQAMLILAIGLDGYTHQEKALQILLNAQDIALEIGMNKREFAFINGNGSAVLEESWRRTWWEMYVVDGMIAGVHQRSTFRMKELVSDVTLPCEEKEYISGVSQSLVIL